MIFFACINSGARTKRLKPQKRFKLNIRVDFSETRANINEILIHFNNQQEKQRTAFITTITIIYITVFSQIKRSYRLKCMATGETQILF